MGLRKVVEVMKKMLRLLLAMLTLLVANALPINTSTLGKGWYQQKGYLMEGDYSAYVGKRITVHGVLKPGYAERVLEVTWIEEPYQPASLP